MTAPPESESPAPSPRRRRLLWTLGILAVLSLAFRVALPYALAWGIGYGAETQGLVAQVRNVDLGLFAGTLALEGLTVAPPGRLPADGSPLAPEEALFAVERLHANVEWTDLVRGEVRLSEIEIQSPMVRLERQPDGKIDPLAGAVKEIEEVVESATDEESVAVEQESGGEDEEAEAGGGWPIHLDRLDLRQARLRLVDASDGGEIGEFDLEQLGLQELSFIDGAVGLGGIDIRGPSLEVDRKRALAAPTEPSPSETEKTAPEAEASSAAEEASPPAAQPHHRIDRLAIERAEFKLQVGEQVLDVPLQLEATDVGLAPDTTFPLKVGLEIEEGRIDVEGQVGAVPVRFDGTAAWKDLPVPLIAMAALPELRDWLRSSRASGDAELHFAAEHDPGLRARINLQLDDVEVANPGEKEEVAVAWKQLAVVVKELVVPLSEGAATKELQVHIAKVSLVEPQIHYTRPAPSLEALLAGGEGKDEAQQDAVEAKAAASQVPDAEAAAQPSAPATAAPAPQIRIDVVEVRGGNLQFDDNAVSPAYSGKIHGFEVDVGSISLPEASIGKIDVQATLPGGSKLTVAGHLAPGDGEIEVDLKRLELPPINPYAAAAGLQVAQGALTLDTSLTADGPRWDVESQVTLHDLSLDSAGSQGFIDSLGMPLDLVLSVLRDPSGDISLPVSVALEEGAVETDLVEIVMGALRQALVGAATIPLKGLGAVFNRDGQLEFEPIPFPPGLATPTEESLARAPSVVDFLETRPTLGAVLAGRTGPDDRDMLAMQILVARLEAGEGLPPLDADPQPGVFARRVVQGALRKRAQGKTANLNEEREALFAGYVGSVQVPDERYAELARARAVALRELVMGTERITEERIQLGEPAKRGAPGVVVDYVSLDE